MICSPNAAFFHLIYFSCRLPLPFLKQGGLYKRWVFFVQVPQYKLVNLLTYFNQTFPKQSFWKYKVCQVSRQTAAALGKKNLVSAPPRIKAEKAQPLSAPFGFLGSRETVGSWPASRHIALNQP